MESDTLRARLGRDDGFTMPEAIASMAVMLILAALVGTMHIATIKTAKDNRARTTAANLVATQIERAQGLTATQLDQQWPLDAGFTLVDSPTIQGTSYRVYFAVSTADRTGTFRCGDNTLGSHLRLDAVALWGTANPSPRQLESTKEMGSTRPVGSYSLKAVTPGELDPGRTRIAVQLVNKDDQPITGTSHSVGLGTVAGAERATAMTNSLNGCAIFNDQPSGQPYRVYVNSLSLVDVNGTRGNHLTNQLVQSTDGKTQAYRLMADRPGQMQINFTPMGGGTITRSWPVSASFHKWNIPSDRTLVLDPSSTNTRRVSTGLFPGNYRVWAGNLPDNKPSDGGVSITVVSDQMTTLTNVPLGGLRVTNTGLLGSTLNATPCCNSPAFGIGRVSGWSTVTFAVPYGAYTLRDPLDFFGVAPRRMFTRPEAPVDETFLTGFG